MANPRTTLKQNCDCTVRHRLPELPKLDLCLYHWSPTRNRSGINRHGLRPGQKTLQGDWRPPYVCFSDDPLLAWTLSGDMWPDISSWDLWMVHVPSATTLKHFEVILDTFPDTGRHYVKEYRVYERVYKRDLHYLATRTQ